MAIVVADSEGRHLLSTRSQSCLWKGFEVVKELSFHPMLRLDYTGVSECGFTIIIGNNHELASCYSLDFAESTGRQERRVHPQHRY